MNLEPVVETRAGRVRLSELPAVTNEHHIVSDVRMLCNGFIILVISMCIVYYFSACDVNLVDINVGSLKFNKTWSGNGDTVNGGKKNIYGNSIWISSHLDDLILKKIIPIFDEYKEYGSTLSSVFDGKHNMSISRDNGTLYNLNFGSGVDRKIKGITVIGSNNPIEYEKLETVNIVIRDAKGLKIWQSSGKLEGIPVQTIIF